MVKWSPQGTRTRRGISQHLISGAGAMDRLVPTAEGLQGRAAWLQLLHQLLQHPHLQQLLLAGASPSRAERSTGARDSSVSHGPAPPEAAGGDGQQTGRVPGSGASEHDEAGEGEAARSALFAFLAALGPIICRLNGTSTVQPCP